ncbi:hypothetical protein DFH11DRAFT_1588322 [Phellopilus nigrolimitatus]|nr:hypothetical protein DFH11DRAFT_1588322 [Phellopilus nigrolimitatus]
MQSANNLPDELIKDILKNVLHIPQDKFSRPKSEFGRDAVPSSHVLLVNKRWLRIASPLLYECVVLRNTPQTQAFRAVLRGKAGSQLTRFVRRIRLEGCFGADIGKIFATLPGVTDLFLTQPCNAGEKVNGICQGLLKLSPIRVFFNFKQGSLWKNSFEMANALCEGIRKWKTLSTFEIYIPLTCSWKNGTLDNEKMRLGRLAAALSEAPNLLKVVVHIFNLNLFDDEKVVSFVKAIGRSLSLQAIHLHVSSAECVESLLSDLSDDPCVHIVRFFQRNIKQSPISQPWPARALPENVYEGIVDASLQSFDMSSNIRFSEESSYRRHCMNLMLVSKLFYAITLPLAFRFIGIWEPDDLTYLANKFSKNTQLASYVKTLVIAEDARDSDLYEVTSNCASLLRCMSNLVDLSIFMSCSQLLPQIAHEAQMGLRCLKLQTDGGEFRPRDLMIFPNLRSLIFDTDFNQEKPRINMDSAPERVCLLNVTSVTLAGAILGETNDIILVCDFPSVDTLEVRYESYLYEAYNSANNDSMILASFPNLKTLLMTGDSIRVEYLQIANEHGSLEKCILDSCGMNRKELQREEGRINKVLDQIDFGKFKALKELQLRSVDQWPWQDCELKNSAWPRRAEALVQRYGITITDANGIPWRPRTQHRGRR